MAFYGNTYINIGVRVVCRVESTRVVETLGRVAIAMGVYAFLSGVSDMANTCAQVGETFPFSVYCSGFKVALIAPLYSIIVYVIISLVDMVRRPRI